MRYLNIEVALGLVAIGIVASRVLGTPLPPTWFIVVPLTCWAVYTLDRVFDSRDPRNTPNTGRHKFHARYRRPLVITSTAALVLCSATAVVTFPLSYWIASVPLGLLTLLHIALQRTTTKFSALVKDLNVVLTYTLSGWMISIVDSMDSETLSGNADSMRLYTAAFCSFALVLVDVVLLSRIDRNEDAGAGRPSIAVVLGDRSSRLVGTGLCMLVLVVSLGVISTFDQHLAITFCAMSAAYFIFSFKNLAQPDNARLALELVLVMPILLLLT